MPSWSAARKTAFVSTMASEGAMAGLSGSVGNISPPSFLEKIYSKNPSGERKCGTTVDCGSRVGRLRGRQLNQYVTLRPARNVQRLADIQTWTDIDARGLVL